MSMISPDYSQPHTADRALFTSPFTLDNSPFIQQLRNNVGSVGSDIPASVSADPATFGRSVVVAPAAAEDTAAMPSLTAASPMSRTQGQPVADPKELARRLALLDQQLQYFERREGEAWRQNTLCTDRIHNKCTQATATLSNLEQKLSSSLSECIKRLEQDGEAVRREVDAAERRLRQMADEAVTRGADSAMQCDSERYAALSRRMELVAEGLQRTERHFEARVTGTSNDLERRLRHIQSEVDAVAENATKAETSRQGASVKLLQLLEESCTAVCAELQGERAERQAMMARLERRLEEAMHRGSHSGTASGGESRQREAGGHGHTRNQPPTLLTSTRSRSRGRSSSTSNSNTNSEPRPVSPLPLAAGKESTNSHSVKRRSESRQSTTSNTAVWR